MVHNSDCFYVYDANIGIIFNTTKYSSIKSCFRDYFTKLVRESHKAAPIGVEKLAYARLFKLSCVSRLYDELRSQLFEQNIGLERLHDLH